MEFTQMSSQAVMYAATRAGTYLAYILAELRFFASENSHTVLLNQSVRLCPGRLF
jgi:hypothetical protein